MNETEYLLNSNKNRERLKKSMKEATKGKTKTVELGQLDIELSETIVNCSNSDKRNR